jgi:transcriptional regulator with XRE-family HTH domain
MKMNVRDVGNFIREQRRQAGVSVRKLAKLAGVSNPYLSQIERGLRRPSAEILNGIAKGLRISAETLYVQAGILDDRKDREDLTDAILADRGLTERQKQVLVQVYSSFREDTERDRAARRRRRAAKPKQAAPALPHKPGGRVESAG